MGQSQNVEHLCVPEGKERVWFRKNIYIFEKVMAKDSANLVKDIRI